MSDREAGQKAIDAVKRLIADLRLPSRMRDIGVEEADIRPMAEATMGVTRLLRSNPRRVHRRRPGSHLPLGLLNRRAA